MAPMLKALSMRVSRTSGNPPVSPPNVEKASSEPRQQLETAFSDDSSVFSGLPSIQSPRDNEEIQEQFSSESNAQSSVFLNRKDSSPCVIFEDDPQKDTQHSRQTSIGKYNMKTVSVTQSESEEDDPAAISVIRSGSISAISETRSVMRNMEPIADREPAETYRNNYNVDVRESLLGAEVTEQASADLDIGIHDSCTMSFESVHGVQRPRSRMNFISEVQFLNDEGNTNLKNPDARRQHQQQPQRADVPEQKIQQTYIKENDPEYPEKREKQAETKASPSKQNERRITDLLHAYEEQMDQNLTVIRSEDNESYLAELQDIIPRRVQSQDEKQMLTQTQTRRIRRILNQARTEVEVLKDNNEQFMSEIEQMEEENRSEMKLVEERHKQKINELKATYQQEIDAVVKEKDAMIVETSRQTSKCLEAGRKQISLLKMQIEKLRDGLTDKSVTEKSVDEAVEAVEKKKDAEMAAKLATLRQSYEGQMERDKLEINLQAKLKMNDAVSSVTRRMLADRDREVKEKERSLRKKFEAEKGIAIKSATEVQKIELDSLRRESRAVICALESVQVNLRSRYPDKIAEMQQRSVFVRKSGPFQLLQNQEEGPKSRVETLLKEVFEEFSFILDASDKKSKSSIQHHAEEIEKSKREQEDSNDKIFRLEESVKKLTAEKRSIENLMEQLQQDANNRTCGLEESLKKLAAEKRSIESLMEQSQLDVNNRTYRLEDSLRKLTAEKRSMEGELEQSKRHEEESKNRIFLLEASLSNVGCEKLVIEEKYRRAMEQNLDLSTVEKGRQQLALAIAEGEAKLAHTALDGMVSKNELSDEQSQVAQLSQVAQPSQSQDDNRSDLHESNRVDGSRSPERLSGGQNDKEEKSAEQSQQTENASRSKSQGEGKYKTGKGVYSHLLPPEGLRMIRRSKETGGEQSLSESFSPSKSCSEMQEVNNHICLENISGHNTLDERNTMGMDTHVGDEHYDTDINCQSSSYEKHDEDNRGIYSHLPENIRRRRRRSSLSGAEASDLGDGASGIQISKPNSTGDPPCEDINVEASHAVHMRHDPEESGAPDSSSTGTNFRKSGLEKFKHQSEKDQSKSECSSRSYSSKKSILARKSDPEESSRATVTESTPGTKPPGSETLKHQVETKPSKPARSRSYRSKRSILVRCDPEESPSASAINNSAPEIKAKVSIAQVQTTKSDCSSRSYRRRRSIPGRCDPEESPRVNADTTLETKSEISNLQVEASQSQSEASVRSFRGTRSILVRSQRKDSDEGGTQEIKQATPEPTGSKDAAPANDPVKHKSFAILRSFKAKPKVSAPLNDENDQDGASEHSRRARKFRSIFETLKTDDISSNRRESLAEESLSSLQADPGTSPPQSPRVPRSPRSEHSRRLRRTTPLERMDRSESASREDPSTSTGKTQQSKKTTDDGASKSTGKTQQSKKTTDEAASKSNIRKRNPFAMFTHSKADPDDSGKKKTSSVKGNQMDSPSGTNSKPKKTSKEETKELPHEASGLKLGCNTLNLKKSTPSGDGILSLSNDTNDDCIPVPPKDASIRKRARTLKLKKAAPADGESWGELCSFDHKKIEKDVKSAGTGTSEGSDKAPLGEITNPVRNRKKSLRRNKTNNPPPPHVLNGKKPAPPDWTKHSQSNAVTASGSSTATKERNDLPETITGSATGSHAMWDASTLSHSTDGPTFNTPSGITSGTAISSGDDDDCLKCDTQSQLRKFPPLGDDASDDDSGSDSDCTDRYTSLEPPVQFANDYSTTEHVGKCVPIVLSRSVDESPVLYMDSGESKPIVVQGRPIYRQPELSAFSPHPEASDTSSEATTAITTHTFRSSLQMQPRKKLPSSPRELSRGSMLHPPPPPDGLPPPRTAALNFKGRRSGFRRVEI